MITRKTVTKPKVKFDIGKYKKWILYFIVFLVFVKINKVAAFIALFSVVTTIAKFMRTKFGMPMVVFDPLLFCAILLMYYYGLFSLIVFVSICTLLIDAPTGLLEFGSFVNWFLYIGCPFLVFIFIGKMDLIFYGNVVNILYTVVYIVQKLTIFPGDPFNSIAKGVTSGMFTFLYLVLLGPVFHIILTSI
jgi:hypothetical protein